MYASFIAVALHIAISLGLMRVIGFRAFPLATTIASFINLAILMHKLPKKIGAFELSPLVDYSMRLVIASILSGFVGIILHRFLMNILGLSFLGQILNLGISGCVTLILCYVACILLGVTEAKDYIKRLLKR